MTYSDWLEELSEKYQIIKGLYKVFKTPGVIKASPKFLLKNKLSTKTFDVFKKNLPVKPPVKYSQPSLSTPNYKPFKPGSDAVPYSTSARSISRRLNYTTKDGQTFKRNPSKETGDVLGDISSDVYKKEGKKSLERRLTSKEKIRQQWLKDNNLPPDSNAKPPGFNEEALAAPTNNASSGAIAGLPPDNPPVKKRKNKTYAYGGIGSRKMWMKNKYT